MQALKRWKTHLALFFLIVGPGIITANVDNDAGGIATYSVAGAKYGYTLLWVLLPTCFLLVLVQEMCCRMGVVTGKGLSALIRERFGIGISFYLMLALVATNVGNVIADFAGVAAASEIFGLHRAIAVPVGAFLLWHVVVKGSYRTVEKVFFVACAFYVAYLISGFLAKPDWHAAAHYSVVPHMEWNKDSFYMVVGIVGTTIAPWMQFYQQASVVEKGIPLKHLRYSQLDTAVGAIVVTIVCYFIVLACAATLNREGITAIETAGDAAAALKPAAGKYCADLFAFGLLTAGLFGAAILPISTATSVCEAMGWESGVDRKFMQAPQYYSIFTFILLAGVVVALVAGRKLLVPIMLLSQVINGILLPVVIFFMLRITGDRAIMGEHANSRLFNIIAWTGAAVTAAMSLILTYFTIFG